MHAADRSSSNQTHHEGRTTHHRSSRPAHLPSMARHSKPEAISHPGRLTALASSSSATRNIRPVSASRTTTAIRAATADALVQATTPSAPAFIPTVTFTAPPAKVHSTIADAVKNEINELIASFSPEISEAVQSFKNIDDLPVVEAWEVVPAPLALRRGKRRSAQRAVVEDFDQDLGLRSSPLRLLGELSQHNDNGRVLRGRDSAVELAALGGDGMVEMDGAAREASEIVEFFASLVGSDEVGADKGISLGAFR
ncbi:hypothetical protein EJ03DRAFT_121398 [Teratosphaeria nubilosa]|uniref:Uncharacterized protein n=1 Tax=Teratosphaeria nubilosa TaxID=161662 RepID=A0A6G1L6R7_9PEZI|nr:hypothetical protein EJ03DRAFT_121398 [Teratosphaeria nubilosa]